MSFWWIPYKAYFACPDCHDKLYAPEEDEEKIRNTCNCFKKEEKKK